MSTVSENPTLACPQTTPDACSPPLAPVAPPSAAPTAEEEPPRPSKSALLRVIPRLDAAAGSPGQVPSECGHNPG
jgi:hypothetical protein